MRLDSLYQEIILDHYRHPHHAGLREPFDAEVRHVNPVCGDEVTLRVTLKDSDAGNGRGGGAGASAVVADVSYDALGCSISQASASVLADLLIGRTVTEGMKVNGEFLALMQSQGEGGPDEDVLGDAVAFAGVSKYPARIKCALLAWMAWKDATAQAMGEREPARGGIRERGSEMSEETVGVDEATAGATVQPGTRAQPGGAAAAAGAAPDTEDLLEALRDVVDPELGVNVVDLGLVYGVTVGGDGMATIDMTLTSAACPLTDVIEDQAASALEGLVNDFRINWVWIPPWGPDKITEDGREQLRALGFNV